jgi:hypothetical protein
LGGFSFRRELIERPAPRELSQRSGPGGILGALQVPPRDELIQGVLGILVDVGDLTTTLCPFENLFRAQP